MLFRNSMRRSCGSASRNFLAITKHSRLTIGRPQMISHPKYRKFLAYLSVVLLLVGSPNVLLGSTSEGYQQAAISGRSSIAIVAGPGRTKIDTYNGNLFLTR